MRRAKNKTAVARGGGGVRNAWPSAWPLSGRAVSG